MNNPEADIASLLLADSALTTLLSGGIYQSGQVGIEGITRLTAPAAFDAQSYLKPCALVRQRVLVLTNDVLDFDLQVKSAAQTVEVWLYQDAPGYDVIDEASGHVYRVLQGVMLPYSFELDLVNLINRLRDDGALANASLGRLDFAVYSIVQA